MDHSSTGIHPLLALFDLYLKFRSQQSVFCYRGVFNEEFTSTIIDISEGANFRSEINVNRKVSFLLVECFQNIIKHGENHSEVQERSEGIFSYRLGPNGFIINSINPILQQDKPTLKHLVDEINSKDSKELKELYIRKLSENQLTEKGGAGLGLIELARKSGQKLLYQFEDVREDISLFHQQVTFLSNEEAPMENLLEDTGTLDNMLALEDAFLMYKGDFSQKSILPILSIVEQNVSTEGKVKNTTRKVAHLLVELLQNISKHSQEDDTGRKEGIFLIGKTRDSVFIECGNEINEREMHFLKEKLSYLTSLSTSELVSLHKTAMKASIKFENKYKSGLGLIEVVKGAEKGVVYSFEKLDTDKFLFAIKISF